MTDVRSRTVWRLKDGGSFEVRVTALRDGRVVFHPLLPGTVRSVSLDRTKFMEMYKQVGGGEENE